jgi:hypothetical protein
VGAAAGACCTRATCALPPRLQAPLTASISPPRASRPAPQDSWSPEEDARLRTLYNQYGTSWSRISKALKGRTSQQCRARWHQLDSGRSRRSAGGVAGGAAGGGSGSGGAGSTAAGGRASVKRRGGSAQARRERFNSSDSGEDFEDEEEDEEEGLSDGGDAGGAGAGAANGYAHAGSQQGSEGGGGGGGGGADGAHAASRQRLAAHKQAAAGGRAAPAASPRRPPRGALASGPSSGASTPKRRGDGAPDSPAIHLVSPRLMSPPGAGGGGGGSRLGAAGALEGGDAGDADGAGWQQLAQAQGLDAQEAAGAETLLHMAAVFRRGSGELEPPAASLRRSDFITGVTPTKRSPARRPAGRLSDDLSPSPFKKAHSLAAEGGGGGDLLAGLPDFKSRLAAAAADADEEMVHQRADGGGAAATAAQRSGGRRLTAKRSARRAGSALPFRSDDSGDAEDDEAMDDAVGESDGGALPGPMGFGLHAPPAAGFGADGLTSPLQRGAGGGASSSLLSPRPVLPAGREAMLTSPKFEVLATGVRPQPGRRAALVSAAARGRNRNHLARRSR